MEGWCFVWDFQCPTHQFHVLSCPTNVTVDSAHAMDVLQLLLERKINEVGKIIKETEEKITDLAENISQAKVSSSQKCLPVWN